MNGWIITIIVFVVLEGILISEAIHTGKETDSACQQIGLESFKSLQNMKYCEDKEGNLHYIKMECEPWYWWECTAKTISVGDVRVK